MERVLDLNDPEMSRLLEETVAQVRTEIRPLLTEPIRQSAILTAKDYMIRFNDCPLEYK